MLALGREVLARQSFSRLLGTELVAWNEQEVRLELAVTEDLKQQNGFVHGGVLSYLADNTLTFAGGGALGPAVVTSEYKINYLRPALGQRLIAKGSVVHAGRSQAVVRCEIYSLDKGREALCAAAQGTIARLPVAPAAAAISPTN